MMRVIIKVFGRVQAVGFRWYTKLTAQNLGLTGFAANETDGSVTIVAEGSKEKLQKLVDWARHGPQSAAVTKIETKFSQATGEFSDFEIS